MTTQIHFSLNIDQNSRAPHRIAVGYTANIDQALKALALDDATHSIASQLVSKAKEKLKDKAITKSFILGVEQNKELSISIILLPHSASRNLPQANFDAFHKAISPLIEGEDSQLCIAALRPQDIFGFATVMAKLCAKYSQKSDHDTEMQNILCSFIPSLNITPDDISACEALANAVQNTAKLVDMPPNILNPTSFADIIVHRAQQEGLSCEIITGVELAEKGFGGIYNVGKAAPNPPCLCILRYAPPEPKSHIALVGKGITYDTGGLCLKSREHITTMKCDMAGAAACLEFICLAAKRGAPIAVDAVICVAENVIAHNAYRPDDIITLYSGKTVEINNTDAEGRLLLADGVAYASKVLKPDTIIDMATLTGAQLIATGKVHAGILCNNAGVETALMQAGLSAGETVYPMLYAPEILMPEFKSEVADMKNSCKDRMNAQSSAAGHFVEAHLQDFSGSWAHIDIAGPAWKEERATGYGVALLFALFLIQG